MRDYECLKTLTYFMELFVFQIHDTPIIVLWIVKQRTEVSCVICSDSQGVTSTVICRYILSEISEFGRKFAFIPATQLYNDT